MASLRHAVAVIAITPPAMPSSINTSVTASVSTPVTASTVATKEVI